MTVTRTKDGVPGWNGDPSTWLEFKQAARLYVASTKVESRYTCGPKIAAELVGAAKTAIMGKKSSWLSEATGAETLLKHLHGAIGEPALPEVGNFMRQYFKTLRRQRGESMTSFCVRHREEYEKMCRSLARMCKENKPRGASAMSTTSRPTDTDSTMGIEGQGGREDSKETPTTELKEEWDPNDWWSSTWSGSNYGWWSYSGWRQSNYGYAMTGARGHASMWRVRACEK